MNRKKKSMLTASIAIIVALLEGILSIVRMKVVLITFGDSSNAIMQIAVQITTYLVLVESGMTAAYQLKLYKPLSNGDSLRVSELFLGLKKNLRDIVFKMIVIINIVSFVYVFLLLNTDESKIVAFFIFLVMGLRFITPYIFTLPERTLLIASEKGYIANAIQGLLQCSTLLIEVLLCKFTRLPLPAILFSYIFVVIICKALYVYCRKKVLRIELVDKVNPDFEPRKMTKDIFVHQIAGMITNNTDSFLLSIMNTLTNVTIYSAYTSVINYPITLFTTIINSVKASIIVKMQNKDENAYDIYENMLRLSCFVMSIFTAVFFLQINNFMALWIGKKYELNIISVAIFACILYMRVVLNVLTIGVDVKGIYKETKKVAFSEAAVNLVLTIALIPFLGITGALIGTVISLLFVKWPIMGYIIYKDVFHKKNVSQSIILNGLLCTLVTILVTIKASTMIHVISWLKFALSVAFSGIIVLSVVLLWYLITEKKLVLSLVKAGMSIIKKTRNKT